MDVKRLHELLGELMKKHPESKHLPIRVIEESDYEDVEHKEQGEPKPNYWLSFDTVVEDGKITITSTNSNGFWPAPGIYKYNISTYCV